MPNYNYTHGSTAALSRVRFLLGDNRGTNGTSATGWMFSDEELGDCLILAGTTSAATTSPGIPTAARIALQSRICREAMGAGVAGTTDTTDRPQSLINAERAINTLDYPGAAAVLSTTPAAIEGLNGDDVP